MRDKNWQPSTPLSVALRRVISREKAAIARRKCSGGHCDGLETLESRWMMSAVHGLHTALPTIPSGITAIALGPASVQVQWVDKDTSVTGYNILRSANGGDYAQVGHITSRSTVKFTDTAVTSNHVYSYEIQAIGAAGTSNSAAVAATTPLIAPTALTASARSGTSAQLNWTNNDAGAAGYYVLRAGDGTHFSNIANVTSLGTTMFLDTGLASGHAYSYEVQAYAGSTSSAVTKAKAVTTPLAAPSRLSATALTSTSVSLTWADNDSSASGYYVLRGTDGTHYTQLTKIAAGTANTFIDKNASSLKKFYYKIEAFTTATASAASDGASASTPLTVPATAAVTAINATSAKVTWVDTDTSALGYYVLRATNGSDFAQVGQVTSGKTNTFTDATLASNQAYQYKIEAYSGSNTSLASNVTIVTTPLATPTAATATAQSGTVIQLQWADNDAAATGYKVLRAGDGVHFTQIGTISSGSATSYTDSTLTSGHAYAYEVQAITGSNASAVSTVASAVTPLAAPSGLGATVQSSSVVALAWTDNDASATGYIVLRSTDGTHFSQLTKLTGATVNNYTDRTTASLLTYSYEVQASSGAATSAASNVATGTTPLAVPTAATATALSATSVKLTWTDVDPAALGYFVLRAINGTNFSQIGQITSGKTTTYTDSAATTNGAFQYEVEAYSGSNTSLASNVAIATTPLAAPTAATATPQGGTAIALRWTDNDSSATGYNVLRATDGVHFAQIGSITSGDANSYTDSTVASGHAYSYEIQAFAGSNKSAVSNAAAATTPLAAPSSLTATALTGTSIRLNWTNNDTSAAGYYVLRSTDGNQYTQVAKVTTATAATYTDATVSSAKKYYYEVTAFDAATTSAISNSANAITPMLAPTALTTTNVGSFINLKWTNADSTTTGYNVLRSTDGTTFAPLVQVNSAATTTYADTSVTAGQKYYYEVQASNATLTSPASNVASATAVNSGTGSVAISTRYGNELVISATGTSDTVSVAQNGSTLTITADGQSYSDPVPAAGLFLYTRGGSDAINIASSVTLRTTVETIDGAMTDITSAGANVSAWADSNDLFTGTGTIHLVSSFAGGVSKATGASLRDPTDSGTVTHFTGSLWGTGPVAGDINQGSSGDCYFLSSLAAFAGEKSSVLLESAVDMGDGTYTVQFYSGSTSVDVRVSNDMPVGGFGGYKFAHPGSTGDGWALVMEKAYADFRTGANTYASLDSGWMGAVYANLGVSSTNFFPGSYSETTFYNMVSTDLANGKAVTLGTTTAPNLVSGHAYTLISASIDGNGVTHYVVRNPWGVSGDSLENGSGYATLTFAQMQANFYDGCQAA